MASLSDLQRDIAEIRKRRGFTVDPIRLLTLLTEEVGEVAGELKKTWSENYPALITSDLADELADVLVLLSALATRFDIDLEAAVARKFVEQDSKRDWTTARKDPSDE